MIGFIGRFLLQTEKYIEWLYGNLSAAASYPLKLKWNDNDNNIIKYLTSAPHVFGVNSCFEM